MKINKSFIIFLVIICASLSLDADRTKKKNRRGGRPRSASTENIDIHKAIGSSREPPDRLLRRAREVAGDNAGNWNRLLNQRNEDEQRPIDVAWNLRRFAWMQELVFAGADFEGLATEERPSMAWQLLDVESIAEFEVLRQVIVGPDILVRNASGDLPLHEAVQELIFIGARDELYGNIMRHALFYFLDGGSDIDALGQEGRTVFQMAVSNENLELAGVLLERGADINALDSRRGNAFQIALPYGNLELMSFLVDHGALFYQTDIVVLRTYIGTLPMGGVRREHFEVFLRRLILLNATRSFHRGGHAHGQTFRGKFGPDDDDNSGGWGILLPLFILSRLTLNQRSYCVHAKSRMKSGFGLVRTLAGIGLAF